MTAEGQRTPTNRTGSPVKRLAQSGRILLGTEYHGDIQPLVESAWPRGLLGSNSEPYGDSFN
jgi:hypothetical protein